MLKKTVRYKDPFTKEEVEEDLYFHLTQAEIAKLELSEKGGLSEALKRLLVTEDGKEIMEIFERIILMSYGIRNAQGKHIKNEELRSTFLSSEAYSAFFMELIMSTDAQIEFIRGLAPPDLADEALAAAGLVAVEEPGKEVVLQEVPKPEPEHITRTQFLDTPAEEMEALMTRITSGEVVVDHVEKYGEIAIDQEDRG